MKFNSLNACIRIRFLLALGICGTLAGCEESAPRYPSASRVAKDGYFVKLLFEPNSSALAYGFVASPALTIVKTNAIDPDIPSKGILWCTRYRDGLWINGQRVPAGELTGLFVISAAGLRTPIDLYSAEIDELIAAGTDIGDTNAWREKVAPIVKQTESGEPG
jgi:hypothetical protein